MLAVKAGKMQAVQVLYIYYDKNIDKDDAGNHLLYSAAMNGREEIVKTLLKESKKEINTQNTEGKTALIIAAEYGYTNIVEILVENGADQTIKSKEGKVAFDYAVQWEHQEIIEVLK